jgi:ribonuclease HII
MAVLPRSRKAGLGGLLFVSAKPRRWPFTLVEFPFMSTLHRSRKVAVQPGLPLRGDVSGLLAGVDEAGRGPWAGAVVAAAVILDPAHPIVGLNDSKKLSAAKREVLYAEICEKALCYSIAEASAQEIDQINILQATFLAMHRAVQGLVQQPNLVLVDGNRLPSWPYAAEAIVGGDAKVAAIAAASILAKVTRDRACLELDARYPLYGFAQHKGYGTRQHQDALHQHGPCPAHRYSYAPVRAVLSAQR